jgi:hypothetical protein
MPKPINTTGDRDFARKLYMGKRPYVQKMKGVSHSAMDRIRRVPHSESKKPYVGDDDYPEMEYRFDPWDPPPYRPPNQPPTGPNDPNDPDTPPVDGCVEGPATGLEVGGGGIDQRVTCRPKDKTPFLGCDFAQPLTPTVIKAGETAYAKLARRDDSIVSLAVFGPATIISDKSMVALCTSAGQDILGRTGNNPRPWASSPECTVIIKAQSAERIARYKPSKETGLIMVVLVAYTQSGSSCSTWASIQQCPADPELEFDTGITPESITPSSYALLAVKGGLPPYRWTKLEASNSDNFSLGASAGNTAMVYANSLACGPVQIQVEDKCGTKIVWTLRCTNGLWVLRDTTTDWNGKLNSQCVTCGYAQYSTWPHSWGQHGIISGFKRCECGGTLTNWYGINTGVEWGVACASGYCGTPAGGHCVEYTTCSPVWGCKPCVIWQPDPSFASGDSICAHRYYYGWDEIDCICTSWCSNSDWECP